MEKTELRVSISRAVHARNGRPREVGLYATRIIGTGEDPVVQRIHIHSLGKDVAIAVQDLNHQGELRRQGDPSQLITLTEGMGPMRTITRADLNRSRGIGEGALRKVLADRAVRDALLET